MNFFRHGIAFALMGLACTTAIAQDIKVRDKESNAQRRADKAEARAERLKLKAAAESGQDAPAIAEYFAGKLMLMDQSTIHLAQLAETKSQNENVKQFARMLVEEHSKCSEKLRECAPGIVGVTKLNSVGIRRAAGFRGTTDAEGTLSTDDHTSTTERDSAQAPDGAAGFNQIEPVENDNADNRKRHHGDQAMTTLHRILQIERQATDNYVQATTEMLRKFDGQEFDMGFLGFTIGSHTRALAELKAMSSVGDEKFQTLISNASANIERHMGKAEELSREIGIETSETGNTTRPEKSEEESPVPDR